MGHQAESLNLDVLDHVIRVRENSKIQAIEMKFLKEILNKSGKDNNF